MYLEHEEEIRASGLQSTNDVAARTVAAQLRRLAACLEVEALAEVPKRLPRTLNPAAIGDGERVDYLQKVRSILNERRKRRQVFGASFVDDPAWAVLLDLFEAYLLQRTRCVKTSVIASGVPATTALRYLAQLEGEGLIAKRLDVCDKRRVLVEITERGCRRMSSYFNML